MSEPQSRDEAVEERLQAFVDTIRDSEPYQEFLEAEARLEADEEALELLEAYDETQQRLQEDEFDQSVMSELRDLQTSLSNNEVIQAYQAAEEDLIELLTETNDAVSEKIGEQFAQSIGGGCC